MAADGQLNERYLTKFASSYASSYVYTSTYTSMLYTQILCVILYPYAIGAFFPLC